jgi:hypothetical protein
MTKMTVATDEHGNVIGAIQSLDSGAKGEEVKASVSFAPGARLHEIDVGPEVDMTKVKDVAKFHEALSRRIPVPAE